MKLLPGFAALICAASILYSPALAAEKDFHDQDLKGKSFAEATLKGANFSEAVLQNCDFSKADLRGANFRGADVRSNMNGANARGADFREATLNVYAEGADFSEANFEGCDMKNVNPFMAKFRGANLKKTKGWGNMSHSDLSKADIRGANLRGMWITPGDVPRLTAAIYDEDTSWPDNFDPKPSGAILSEAPKAEAEENTEVKQKKKPSTDDENPKAKGDDD